MPSYDFSQLSAFDLEMLVHGLLQKEWGGRLEAFKSGRDRGIDLRYSCPWLGSKTIIQCKHYVGSGYRKLLHHLKKDEAKKVLALAPDRYVLVTSVGLTPDNKDEILQALFPYVNTTTDVIGQTELNQLLEKHPDIEQKNFKLWLTSKAVLDRVLHNAELCQTEFAVEKVLKTLPLYVQNACYPRAVEILKKNNVVIISGEPGIGKTTLANIILYSYLSEGYKPVIIVSDLKEGRSLYNKGEKQIFYYDDFLGQTFLRERHGFLLRNEDASLVNFVEMIQASPNAKLIMTTREHILSNALLISDRLRRSPLVDHRCILQIADYGRSERAKILYNHIFFSELPEAYRKALISDNFYENILGHRNFNPRLIEWLSSFRRVREIEPAKYRDFILGILENPQEIWHEAFQRQISNYSRSLLLALFSFGGKTHVSALKPAWKALSDFEARKYNYPLCRDGYKAALKEIEGSFVTIANWNVEFLNPSIKDFISGELTASAERLSDLVQTSLRFEQLVTLWRWSPRPRSGGPGAIISATSEQFVSAVEAAIARPYCRVTTDEKSRIEFPLDLYPEERLAALIAMTEDLQSDRLLALVPAAVELVLERWKETVPDFEETTSILRYMEDSTWTKARLDPGLYGRVRAQMIAELENAYSFYDFMHVDEYLKQTASPETDDEANVFSSGFYRYIKSQFSHDLFDSHDDALSDMADFLLKMKRVYGYNLSREYERVMQTIAEGDQEAERRADNSYDHERDLERVDEEAISNMFDTLR